MSWTIVKELKEKRAKAFADASALREKARKEDRDLSADEATNHDTLIGQVEKIGKDIEREERSLALGSIIAESNVGRDDAGGEKRNSLEMPEKDFRKYSLVRAIQRKLNNQPLDGVEGEVNKEMERRAGKAAQGFFVPFELRALDTTAASGSVMTTTSSDLIELFRNRLVCAQAGATMMSGMQGKFALPRQSGGATAYWLAESGAPTASAQTVDQVLFAPKTVGAFTDFSRQLVNQSSLDVEATVRNDLVRVLALAIDLAALYGTGLSNQPTGIAAASGTTAVSHGTNGGAETWAKIVEYETDVAVANADIAGGKFAYVTNSKVKQVLKTTDKTAGNFGQFILTNDGLVNGKPIFDTNAIPSNLTKGSGTSLSAMIYGNFAELVIATWGALDLLVDPYTGSSSGTVRVVALQDVDIELRHAASFAVAKDIIA